ncbi:MAG: YoaK family protein [Lachnospiraceae bacterium]
MIKSTRISETFLIGAILAMVGGFLDAYTYLCRGGVFANAQTGNLVLMGIKMARGDVRESFYYLVPILTFLIGIMIAETVRYKYKESEGLHWKQITLILEIVVLVAVAFIPTGKYDIVVNAFVSFVFSLQVQSFRKLDGKPYATTMCTGNLRSATEYLFFYKAEKDIVKLHDSLLYFGIVIFFVLGAMGGVFALNHFHTKSMLFACLGLAVIFIFMFMEERENK